MLPLFFIVFFSLFVLVFRSDLYLSKHIFISFQFVNFKLFMCFFVLIFLFTNHSVLCGFAYLFFGFVGSIRSVRRFQIGQIVFVQFFLGLLFCLTGTRCCSSSKAGGVVGVARLFLFVAGGADARRLRSCGPRRRSRGRQVQKRLAPFFLQRYLCKKTFYNGIFVIFLGITGFL